MAWKSSISLVGESSIPLVRELSEAKVVVEDVWNGNAGIGMARSEMLLWTGRLWLDP